MKHLKKFENYEYEDFTYNDMVYLKDLWNDGFRDPEEIAAEMDFSVETVIQMIDTMKISGEINEAKKGHKKKPLYKIVKNGQEVKVIFQKEWEEWYEVGEFTVGKEYEGEVRVVDKGDVCPCVCIAFQSNNGDWSGEIWVNMDEDYDFIKL